MEKQIMEENIEKLYSDFEKEFGRYNYSRMIYDVDDLIKISKKNKGKVNNNIDFNKILNDIPDIKNKVFQVCFMNIDNIIDGKKNKTYVSTQIVMGNLVKKRMKEYFVNYEIIGSQDFFIKQYRKLRCWN